MLSVGCFLKDRTPPIDVTILQAGMEYGAQWAVIIEPYATFRLATSYTSQIAGHGRRGDIHKITGCMTVRLEDREILWYNFDAGWLPESAVAVYSNRLKAERAATAQSD
jgi:hypothetical protein